MSDLRLPAPPSNLDALRADLAKAEALESARYCVEDAAREGRLITLTDDQLAALLDAAREEGAREAILRQPLPRSAEPGVLRQPLEVPGSLRVGGLRQPVGLDLGNGTLRVIDPFAAGIG